MVPNKILLVFCRFIVFSAIFIENGLCYSHGFDSFCLSFQASRTSLAF